MKFGGFAAQSGQNSDTLFPHPASIGGDEKTWYQLDRCVQQSQG